MAISGATTKLSISVVLAIAITLWLACEVFPLEESRMVAIMTVIAAASGTLLGFLLTAMTLMVAVADKTLLKNMRKIGLYQRLIKETFQTCAMLLTTLVLDVVVMFLNGHAYIWTFSIVVAMSFICVCLVVEAGYRFNNVIRHIN